MMMTLVIDGFYLVEVILPTRVDQANLAAAHCIALASGLQALGEEAKRRGVWGVFGKVGLVPSKAARKVNLVFSKL